MLRPVMVVGVVLCGGLLLTKDIAIHAEDLPPEYRPCVHKGLEWLAKQQFSDGHWQAKGRFHLETEQYPIAMTALSGISFLMQGSTLREGKYADNLRRAVDWLVARSMPNGLIGGDFTKDAQFAERYMYGHGFALLFLSCVYGEEGDGTLRRKLEGVLTRAVQFTGRAQSTNGGWCYVSASDSGDSSEGSVTVTQMQALRTARNAGIVVPRETIENAVAFLKSCTDPSGGIRYSPQNPRLGLSLAASGVVCGFSAGEYGSSNLVKRWIRFCQRWAQEAGLASAEGANTHDEYTHLYLSQLIYILGDDRYAQWFPESRPDERLTWSRYRKEKFDQLLETQKPDGSWSVAPIGPVYSTALYLIIMQLDNAALPIYQR